MTTAKKTHNLMVRVPEADLQHWREALALVNDVRARCGKRALPMAEFVRRSCFIAASEHKAELETPDQRQQVADRETRRYQAQK